MNMKINSIQEILKAVSRVLLTTLLAVASIGVLAAEYQMQVHVPGLKQTAETPTTPSCQSILDAGDSTGDGLYTINPTGADPFEVYCDMTTAGGGWMLATKIGNTTGMDRDKLYDVSIFGESWRADTSGWAQGVRPGLDRTGVTNGSVKDVYAHTGWTDIRMACSRSTNASVEEHHVVVNGYSDGSVTQPLGAYANGSSFVVSSGQNSMNLSRVYHYNEVDGHSSHHYLCGYMTGASEGKDSHQFSFCYNNPLTNTTADWGDSLVAFGVGHSTGYNTAWSTYFYGECGDMASSYLKDTGTYWVYVR